MEWQSAVCIIATKAAIVSCCRTTRKSMLSIADGPQCDSGYLADFAHSFAAAAAGSLNQVETGLGVRLEPVDENNAGGGVGRSERVDHVSKQRVKLVARKGSFPISGLQWHQRLRAWRSASSFFTPPVRTCPVGTARFSSRVDVEAARAAILATRAVFSGATFSTALAFARSIAAPPCKQLTFLDFIVSDRRTSPLRSMLPIW